MLTSWEEANTIVSAQWKEAVRSMCKYYKAGCWAGVVREPVPVLGDLEKIEHAYEKQVAKDSTWRVGLPSSLGLRLVLESFNMEGSEAAGPVW